MGLIRRSIALLLPALLAAAPALAADPFVTVKPASDGSTNSAFWILDMHSRPTGMSVEGVALAQINAALDRTQARWCAADTLTRNSFASSSPAVQAEIQSYLGNEHFEFFRTNTRMTGRPLRAVVGNRRSCSGEVAPFVLLVDTRGREPAVVFVHVFADWGPFIVMHDDGIRLIFSSCLECDHAEILSYSRRTRRFSWRSARP